MTRRPLLLCAALLLAAAAPAAPVQLSSQPGTELDSIARKVAAADVEDGGPGALLLLGSQSLGTARPSPALFVQVQSQRACGSAGCSTSVYLPAGHGWQKVLDAVSGPILVAPTQHGGMHDLLVNKSDRWVWNGHTYADTLPAPQVDLRPHRARRVTKTPSPAHP